jgi:hypothetical protein
VDEPWNLGRPLKGDPLRDKKVLFLVRDPRDAAVSAYFHVAKRSRAEARARQRLPEDMLRDLPIFDFILGAEDGRLPWHVAFLNRWLERIRAHPRSLVVRYEDMHADPARVLRRVMGFIGGDITERQIEGEVAFASFVNLRARERQGFFRGGRLRAADPDDPDSYKVRRGKVGGYRDYLTPDQAARVDAFVASHLDPFYGYAAAGAGHGHEEAQTAGPTTTAPEGATTLIG